jgi:SAM-dependent MidA family methyltransferase
LPDSMSGLVIANEFFDALPVHLLRKDENGWNELGVTCDGSRLVFVTMPRLTDELLEYTEKFGGAIPRDGLLEVNLEMEVWISRLDRLLRSGRVLVIDYGYSASELARFPDGTLLTFKQHQTDSRVLLEPGTRDITAHVNFSAMREIWVRAGFRIATDLTLGAWILGIWDEVELGARWTTADERWRLQWKQLLYGMGESFRVLVLEKRAQK